MARTSQERNSRSYVIPNVESLIVKTGGYGFGLIESRRATVTFGKTVRKTARELFGQNLGLLLQQGKDHGLSKGGLADFLAVKHQMVTRWLKGKTLPSKYLDRIAEYLDVPVSALFEELPAEVRRASNDEVIVMIAKKLGRSLDPMALKPLTPQKAKRRPPVTIEKRDED